MHKQLALILAATLALVLSGCSGTEPVASAAKPSTPAPAANPSAAMPDEFIASGPIVVENQVDIAAQRDAMVAAIHFDTGASVRKGQLLAELDSRQVNADLEAARARARSIEADVKHWEAEIKALEADEYRVSEMHKAGLSTKQQLDHAEFKTQADRFELERESENLANARATVRSLELELEKTRIVAPFDGIVARRYVRAGERVASGDRLFWVTATGPMRVKFTLPEQYIGKVTRGAEIGVTAAGEKDRRAKIVQVSPVVDPASGTIEVVAELLGPAGELRPGMTAQVTLPKP